MKQYGFTGKGTGKLGSAVFAISGGEQIVRQYNPVVSNPKTDAQVAQRAKFKLLTQLAAAMSGQIAFRKSKLTSARNKFVSYNIKNATFDNSPDNEQAQIRFSGISLTGSSALLSSGLTVDVLSEGVDVELASAAPANISKVVYLAYHQVSNDKVSFISETVISDANDNRTFTANIPGVQAGDCIFAYGVIENTTKAKVAFDDYLLGDVDGFAFVDVFKMLSASDYSLTETKFVLVSE